MAESWDTPLFTDPKADAVGSVLAFCTVVIASIGGVGGGGLLVPLYKLVLNLGVFAIPLSKATIFGSSLANVILRMSQRHPKADRPLIAYDVALVLEPMTLAGTVAGVMLNAIFPTWAITVLLVLLLCYTAQKTLLKGVSTWKKENKKSLEEMEKTLGPVLKALGASAYVPTETEVNDFIKRRASAWANTARTAHRKKLKAQLKKANFSQMDENGFVDDDEEEDEQGSDWQSPASTPAQKTAPPPAAPHGVLARISSALVGSAEPSFARLAEEEEHAKEKAAIVEEERKVPLWMVGRLAGCWAGLLLLSLMRGGHGAAPLFFPVPCGGYLFWVLPSLIALLCLGITLSNASILRKTYADKLRVGYTFLEGDAIWDAHTTTELPLFCTLAGVAAGMLGIGGGMIQGPLMLEMNMTPAISAATSAFMTLFTSSSTVSQFMLMGMLRVDYGLWYGLVGVAGTIVGQQIAGFVIKVLKRQSVIIFCLGAIIGSSALVMGVVGGMEVVGDYLDADWDAFAFKTLCNEH